jgi:hypothetical protein
VSFLFFLLWLTLGCGYALTRGGPPERVAAGLMVAAFAAGIPVHMAFGAAGYRSAALSAVAIDVLLLGALIVLAWRSTRFWPLWMAACQLAAVLSHVVKLVDPAMQATGYAIQAQIWAYPMVPLAAIGAWRFQRRLRAGVIEPAWKPTPA